MDLSNKSALIYDLSGSFTHIAEAIAPAFGSVKYANQWESGFSNVDDFVPGVGLEGVERVADPFDHFEKVDLVIFPDVGMAGLQEWLRRRGVSVWGAAAASRLETDRVFLKTRLADLGMDSADYEVIEGLSALRGYLAEHDDMWVKVSHFRGVAETYHHLSKFLTEQWLDEKAHALGAYKEQIKFMVEQPIAGHTVEPGIDTYNVLGAYPRRILWGYEDKDSGYLGTIGEVPERLQRTARTFSSILDDLNYRGPLSLEFKSTEEGQDYIIDVTARMPIPPSEAMCLMIKNLPEIMYQGARGILVQPDYAGRYAAQLVMKSSVLEPHEGRQGRALALRLGMPENTLLHGHCRIDKKDYVVSPAKMPEFAGAVGIADTLESAQRLAFEAAESIEGNEVTYSKSSFDDIMDMIEDGDKLDLTWGLFSLGSMGNGKVPKLADIFDDAEI